MGGQDEGELVRPGRAGQYPQDLVGGLAVERGGGVVGEDDGRQRGEGAGDGDPLALVLEQPVGALPGDLADVEAFQPFVGGGVGGLVAGAGEQQRQGDVLPGGQFGHQVGFGADEAEAVAAQPFAPGPAEGVDGRAVEPDLALVDGEEGGEAAEEGALAGAARAGDGEHFALADADRDAPQGGGAVMGLDDPPGPQHVVVRRCR